MKPLGKMLVKRGVPDKPHGLWETFAAKIDREKFRASPQYLLYGPDYPYRELTEYLRAAHLGSYFDTLKEDGAFGCTTALVDGTIVSRDLLDSILELDAIRSQFSDEVLSHAHVLDIGSGYGRFAHRYLEMFPRARLTCVDPVLVSREVCENYLLARGVLGWEVYAPGEVDSFLPGTIDLAVNIHSFSECTREEVRTWIAWLADKRVPHLFLVPHDDAMTSYENEWGCESFRPCIEEHYTLAKALPMPQLRAPHPGVWPGHMFFYDLKGCS